MLGVVLSFAMALIVAATALAPSVSPAQCTFEHPQRAGKFQASLVPAFLPCSTEPSASCCAYANGTTEGGVPSCAPPETFHELFGNPMNGWRWDASKGIGQVSLKASRAFPPNALNPPSNSADIRVQLKLSGIRDGQLAPAAGTGRLLVVARVTLDDRANDDMTTLDLPVVISFTMAGGAAKVKTNVDTYLNSLSPPQPGLPSCSSTEIVSVSVADPNGSTFAAAGIFNP